MQPRIASGAMIQTAGVRKGALRLGSVLRSTITASATIAKANKRARVRIVGELADRQEGRGDVTTMPVKAVTTCGVRNFGWTAPASPEAGRRAP